MLQAAMDNRTYFTHEDLGITSQDKHAAPEIRAPIECHHIFRMPLPQPTNAAATKLFDDVKHSRRVLPSVKF